MSSSRQPTVLQYTGYTDARGGIMTNLRHLASAGSFRSILGVSDGFRDESRAQLEVCSFPAIEPETISPLVFWRSRRVASAVRAWLGQGEQRIFHGHSRAGLLVACWLQAWGEHRVVTSVHCYGRQRWFYRAAKRIFAERLRWLTPAMRRYYYGDTSGEWTDCVPDCVPGRPVPAMRQWTGGRALRLGGAGQLTPNKSWHLVLDALRQLPAEHPVEFYHAGGATDDARSETHARSLQSASTGLAHRVHWLGWQPSLAVLLQEVDALVVPFHHESFSLVALEGLFAGVPIIAARGGGPDDLVIEGVNGWLFPPNDATALARLVRRLRTPEMWRALRMDAAHLERFSAARVAMQWAEIYATLGQAPRVARRDGVRS